MRLLPAMFIVCAWLLAGIPAGPIAEAQDARALFVQGQEAYQQGNYELAIDSWEQAYAIDSRPALQYNLAQAYGRIARIEEEGAALRRFVEGSIAAGLAPDDAQLTSARARLATIADRLRRTGIQLSGVSAGANVRVDGQPESAGDGEAITLSPGPHQLTVTSAGFQDFNASVVVRAGETLFVPVTLQRQSNTADNGGPSGGQLGAILCWSIGGASVIAGGALGGIAMSRSDGAIDGTSRADSARAMALGSDVAIGAGAALGVVGLVLYLRSGDDSDEPAIAVVPMVGSRHAGAQFFGRF